MKVRPEWSQRPLRKGVLVKETYEVFAAWDDSLTESQNLKATLSGRYPTAGWVQSSGEGMRKNEKSASRRSFKTSPRSGVSTRSGATTSFFDTCSVVPKLIFDTCSVTSK